MPKQTNGRLELLTTRNSVLLLVDYQPAMFKGVGSSDKATIWNAAVGAAKAAAILEVPVVLSAINPERNGEVVTEIAGLFPDVKVIARKIPSFDAFEDTRNLRAVKKLNRPKLVVSGLWTSMCFCFTALHALKEGLDVYGLMDASGDSTPSAYKYGVKRMMQAGVVPVTMEALVSEWMHDWNNPKSGDLIKDVYSHFGAMLGLK
jgi:nicotinamidase-related amidase